VRHRLTRCWLPHWSAWLSINCTTARACLCAFRQRKREKWTAYLANPLNGSSIAVIEDTHLGPDDCILETDLGSANFSIDAQMKEIEQGFFDLLAQRPVVK
jgi:hypothetical protein